MMSNSISLKVLEAYTRDVGRNRIRISLTDMKKICASKGDILEAKGKKRTVSVCFPVYTSEKKRGIITMDGLPCGISELENQLKLK